jgi:ribosomal protein S18 acetylase RimI-like enzyme
VLVVDDHVIGVLDVEPRQDHLWLENVAVHPDHQGRGLGRALLAHAESVGREHGLVEIRLLTNERYVDNIAMYRRYGYRETHRRPHLGTDLVYFSKPIPADPRS